MSHYDAVEMKGRALPTSLQGAYIDTIKDKGTLKDIFARHSDDSSSAGYYWLAEHSLYGFAQYRQFSDRSHYGDCCNLTSTSREVRLPVLSVRR